MNLLAVSVSHKTAPINIREMFAFTKKKQVQIIGEIIDAGLARECVLVATCNRTEFYLVNADANKFIIDNLLAYICDIIGDGVCCEDILSYLEIYENEAAIEHLFYTTAGLNSMVIGEDQILGQIKDAHALAIENGTTGAYTNTLFRLAVTASKKVKTQTMLSKTSVSIASLAIKACEDYLGNLNNKNVLVIGASGKFGSVVLKNLMSMGTANVYATVRSGKHKLEHEDYQGAKLVDYADRYDYINDMDAIISATSSAHLILSKAGINNAVRDMKNRIFIDLAVPKDIERSDEDFKYIGIDDFEKLAQRNNELKLIEAKKAKDILNEYIGEFNNWQIFNNSASLINGVGKRLNIKFGDKLASEVLNYVIYKVKAEVSDAELENFIKCIKKGFE